MNKSIYAWIVWSFAALFYSYEFFLRVMPTVMQPELMRAFSLNAVQFSTLSASYYYAYALMQIPVGIMIDRYQLKYILSSACVLVALGALGLSHSTGIVSANACRILMGVGSAFAFTGCIKLAKSEFPAQQVGLIIGLTNTVGVIGAIMADTLFAFLLEAIHWHTLLMISSLVGFLLASLLYACLHRSSLPQHHNIELNTTLSQVLKDKQIWFAAFYGALLVAPISGFAELWSVPFFMAAKGITKPIAASYNSMIFIGIALGGTLNGWIATYLNNRKPMLYLGTLVAALSLSMIIYAPIHSPLLFSSLLILFGYSTSNMLLVFAFNTQRVSKNLVGFSIALTNMIIMLFASLSQPLIGAAMHYLKVHSLLTELSRYQTVFMIFIVIHGIALLLATQFTDPEYTEVPHA